jgi:hypothetical protein
MGFIVDLVEAVVDAIVSIVEAVFDIISSIITSVWEDILEPALEFFFGFFGITDETIFQADKISSKILADDVLDNVRKTQVKAVMEYVQTPQDFYPVYMDWMGAPQAKVKGYYNYGKKRYTHGLPIMTVVGTIINSVSVKAAIDAELAINSTVVSSIQRSTTFEHGWQNALQTLYGYKTGLNELSYPDKWGINKIWAVDSAVDNLTTIAVNLSRTSFRVYFWVYGSTTVVEGDSSNYTIYASETVPAGKSIPINLTYTGTAVDGVDYTSVAQVVMLEGTSSISFSIDTIDNAAAHVDRSFTVTLDTVDNSTDVFDDPVIHLPLSAISTAITDDEGVILTMPFAMANEADVSVSIPVTLENEAPLKLIQTDTFTEGVEYNNPGPDISLTLTVTPEDPSYLVITFDGVVNTDWTLLDAVVTFTVDIPAGTLVIVAETSSRAFTVDYDFTDGTAVGLIGGGEGSDYDSTTGSLSFVGTAGEVQNIVVPVTADVVVDDQESFTVNLVNCSDLAVTLTSTTVTLWDGTLDQVSTNQVETTTFDIAPVASAPRVVTKYHLGNENDWYWWLYDTATGVYPNVTPTAQKFTDMDMMPLAIVRKDKINITEDDPAYRSTSTLIRIISINLKDILSQIGKGDNADVDDAYLNFSVSPTDNNRIVSKIIFQTFYFLHVTNNLTSNENRYVAMLKEGDIENGLAWSDFEWSPDKVGTLGIPIGEYTHTSVGSVITNEGLLIQSITPSKLTLQYRKSANSYDELVIYSLGGLYTVKYDGFSKVVTKHLLDEALTIPVSYYIVKDLDYKELLEVYGYMLRLDQSAALAQHLEWYETQGFLTLFQAIVTFLNIISLGSLTPLQIAIRIAIQYLVYRIVVKVVELTGNVVLAAIIGLVVGVLLGGGKFDTSIFMDAEKMLAITTDFATNLTTGFDTKTGILYEEMEDFKETYAASQAELQAIVDTLPDHDVDAQFLIALQSVNANLYKAVQNQYDYDNIYNEFDRTVSDYFDVKLSGIEVI